ncbi:MAG: hypothetical protein IPP33_16605 [Flavobacteriales bacterium]|nr:hypothetical protein [Flavobacteriales bacterium]
MAKTNALFLALALPVWVSAQQPIPVDDAVLERIDAMSTMSWVKNDPFITDASVLNTHGFALTDTPRYAPDVVRQRLADLDERTPFSSPTTARFRATSTCTAFANVSRPRACSAWPSFIFRFSKRHWSDTACHMS